MSSRKISSESFSSLGSDYPESPDDGECPFSRVFWNGKSPVETLSCPFEDAAIKRTTRRKRVNLDSLGESLRRLTSPTVRSADATSSQLATTLMFYAVYSANAERQGYSVLQYCRHKSNLRLSNLSHNINKTNNVF